MRSYGMEGMGIRDPVRFLEHTEFWKHYNSWNLKGILPEFEKVAMQCIEDGAEVIIPGCTVLSVLLATNDYSKVEGTEVPVLDPVSAEIKMAEVLVDLKKKLGVQLSRVNTYKSIKKIPEDIRSKIREAYGLS